VHSYADAQGSDAALFGRFFMAMLDRGVYFAPSQFETLFLSAAHSDEDLDRTITAASEAFQAAKGS
jgi:glutamate-1-semialdehyde 2,1-aminomutase